MEFEEARSFVQNLKLKNTNEWNKYCKSGNKPDYIPNDVRTVYKYRGWISMGDWLGTGEVADMYKTFRSFKSARSFVRKLKLKNQKEWNEYCLSGNKPSDIPSIPRRSYKDKGWIGLQDWLGSEYGSTQNRTYRSFKSARSFVRKLKLKNTNDWREYSKSGKRPLDSPGIPARTYKEEGWISMGDWIGTGRIADQFRTYRSFKSARSFVRKLKLKNQQEWREYLKSSKRPLDIPGSPDKIYKGKGYVNLGDWLGTGRIQPQQKVWRSFESARSYVRKLNLNSRTEYINYYKSGKLPDDIPKAPHLVYKYKGWIGTRDWFGTERDNLIKNKYRSFISARSFTRKLNLNSRVEWNEYCKSGKLPEDIPKAPQSVYKDKGWAGFSDWLGK